MKRTNPLFVFSVLILGAVISGCSELNEPPVVEPPSESLSYDVDIKPIFDDNCVSCHGSSGAAASYDISTYEGVLGSGSDGVPNAIAGDSSSVLVTKSLPSGTMNRYYANQSDVDLVVKWVVEDSLAEAP